MAVADTVDVDDLAAVATARLFTLLEERVARSSGAVMNFMLDDIVCIYVLINGLYLPLLNRQRRRMGLIRVWSIGGENRH